MQLPRREDTIRAGKSFLHLSVPSFIGFVAEFLASVYIARVLGVTDYGVLGTVYAFVALFRFLPDMGVSQLLIRDIAQDEDSAGPRLSNATVTRLCIAFITVAILNVSSHGVYEAPVRSLIALYSIILVGEAISQPPVAVAIALRRYRLTGTMNLGRKLVAAGLPPLALAAGLGIEGVLWAAVAAAILGCATVPALYLACGVRYGASLDPSQMLGFLRQGYPIALSSCFYLLSTRVDRIMLSKMISMTAVGHYTIAANLLYIVMEGVWVPFAQIVFPTLARTYSTRRELFAGKLRVYAATITSVFVPISLLAVALGKHFIVFVWGIEYTASYTCLAILIWSSVFMGLTQLLYRALIVLGVQAWYLIVQGGGASINIVLNYLLIPRIGVNGAAWSTLLTAAATAVLSVAICRRALVGPRLIIPDR